MKINLNHIANIAKKIFDEQTGEEVATLKQHFGAAYNEAKIVALIATKLIARIAGIEDLQPRDLNGINRVLDGVVERGCEFVEGNYATGNVSA